MKRCPECRRDYYDETLVYCLDDGAALLEGPASGDEPATAVMRDAGSSPGRRGDEKETEIYTSGAFVSQKLKRHRFAMVFVGVSLLILVAGFGYGIYKFFDAPAANSERAPLAIMPTRLTGDGRTRAAEISPDGKFLAYIRTEGGERSIWLKQIQTNSNLVLVKPGELDGFEGLVFSRDGNFLYFDAATQNESEPAVYRVPTLGGTPIKVLTNANSVQFSPDGQKLSFLRFDFAANESSIYLANADGSNERKLTAKSGTEFFDDEAPWSPDGKNLAVRSGNDSLAPTPTESISIVSVDTGSVSQLGTSSWQEINDVVWHPAGDAVIVAAADSTLPQSQLWEISYPAGSVRRLTNNLNGHVSVSITADGKSLVTGELYSRSAIWVSPDLKPENAKQVMPDTADTWGFGWTPDNRIVFVSNQTGDTEIWIMDADGSNARAITSDKTFKMTPVVSPDGRYIVYTSNSGTSAIVRIDMNGSNRLVLSNLAGADNPDISLDNKWVIFSAWVDGKSKILRVPIDGGDPQALTESYAIEPRYSRDGMKIAYFAPNETTQNWTRLAIIPADGGPPIKILDAPPNTNIARGPIWTPDDKGITVVIAPGEQQQLWLQPVDGSPGKQMTDVGVPGIARREYSRDGKRIAIVRAQGVGNAIMITDFR